MALSDRIPLPALIAAAILFGLAPFFPEPHLWEKFGMLMRGDLTRPTDILDVFVHGGPLLLLAWRLRRDYRPPSDELPADSIEEVEL